MGVIFFSILLGVSAVYGIGFLCGVLYAVDPACGPERQLSQRKERIKRLTESYIPSCEELKNNNSPRLVRKGNDYFFVEVQEDYYHVFGINVDPSQPPVLFWWGGGLASGLEQNCLESKSNTKEKNKQ